VLIVEDDDDARALVAKVLQGQGAQVNVVASAREALDVWGGMGRRSERHRCRAPTGTSDPELRLRSQQGGLSRPRP
jgi:CheY-like chemotaxis protein